MVEVGAQQLCLQDSTCPAFSSASCPLISSLQELAQELDIDGLMKRLGLLDGPFIGVHVRLVRDVEVSSFSSMRMSGGLVCQVEGVVQRRLPVSIRAHLAHQVSCAPLPHSSLSLASGSSRIDITSRKFSSRLMTRTRSITSSRSFQARLHVVAVDKYRSLLEEMDKTKSG